MNNNIGRIKIGVYMCAILMMGVIAVSSNLANLMQQFPGADVVSAMISSSCFAIIIMSLVTGKLMDFASKKTLLLIGIILWLVGGIVPYFMASLTPMIVMRVIFGVGCGMVQSCCPAILAENIEDLDERGKATGTMTAFQMIGCMFFSIVAGQLAKLGWNVPFWVHLMAIVSLIFALVCIPNVKPAGTAAAEQTEKPKFQPTAMMWIWVIAFFIFMIAGQEYSNACSNIMTETGIGGAAAAGISLALFAAGGVVCGLIFGALAKALKRFTLTVGCFVLAISYLIMTYATNLPLSLLGAFICGIAFSICMPCILTGAGGSVEPNSAGMAISLATCGQNLGQTLCSFIIPPLGAAWAVSAGATSGAAPYQYGMIVAAIVIAVFGILFIFLNRKGA